MKTFYRFLTTLAALATLAGCVDEEPAYKKNDPGIEPVDPNAVGYVDVSNLTMRVVLDAQTETRPDDTADETQKPSLAAADASGQPDLSAFLVTIFDASGAVAYQSTYGALSASNTGRIELPVGSYTLEVRSEEAAATPAVAWEHPVYFASRPLVVEKNKTTPLEEVVCTLSNIKVTFQCSKDLADQLAEQSTATVTLGEHAAAFSLKESRAAYFLPLEAVQTLGFRFEGAFADAPEKPVRINKTIPDVKGGQWRRITLAITYSDKGDLVFDIVVESLIQDDEIVVDGTQTPEPGLPVAPELVWPDHDLAQPFRLKASQFDAEGNCTEPFVFEAAAPNGLASFEVAISSDNAAFTQTVQGIGGPAFDLCALDPSSAAYPVLAGLGFPAGDALRGATSSRFDLAPAVKMLYPQFPGTHTFAFALTDQKGKRTESALTLVVDPDSETAAPTIVWVGYDIDRQYTVVDGMTGIVRIAAQSGIRSLEVTIDSDRLVGEELIQIGIPERFDLCNIAPENIDALKTLGFPVNEEVKDKTEVTFDITQFLPLLKDFQGKNFFVISVTGNDGSNTTKTLKLFTE